MRADSLRKIVVFGIVGIGASVLHIIIAWAVLHVSATSIFVANLFGFLVAFIWSYLGHYHFTFRSDRDHKQAVPRFALTALLGYVINNAVVLACVVISGTESIWFIVLAVGIAAGAVYLISNRWALGDGS